ncbi:MAG: DUF4321 domain-containing protein [Chitinispirillaceae bacterium]|nr:DUF4321 domain-containing protein [Chitinispirillaceae bacterium]
MAALLKDKPLSGLVFFIFIGIIIGSYLNSLMGMLPGGTNVVKTFFTFSIPIGIGDFASNKPVLIDLNAIKFQIGFQLRISLMTVIGIIVSIYLFKWYR